MASKSPDDGKSDPSLELPSLSLPKLRRRKKATEAPRPSPDHSSDDTAVQGAVDPPAPAPVTEAAPEEPKETPRRPKVARKDFTLPALPGRVAAGVTGVVVGVLATVLTFLALAGCEAIKGTSTCGRPGFFLLVAILIAMILVGMILLKAWHLSDPGSTSFLAVGIVAVIALVVLIDVIFSGWMFVIIPIVSAGAYVMSEWVTTRFVEESGPGVGPDVR